MVRPLASIVAIALIALPAALPAQTAPGWTRASATELLAAVRQVGDDGLDPRDYGADRLAAAIAGDDPAAMAAVATDSYRRLARDLAQGHVGGDGRAAWHITGPAPTPAMVDQHMARALADGRIGAFLSALLPRHPQYAALKAALKATPPSDTARIETLKVNLERWRWLPRDLGARHLIVNVPSFTLELNDGGKAVATHRVIIGKPATPTPQFQATVSGVIVNPWWEIPTSIVAESVGALVRNRPAVARARGYVWTQDAAGHLRVRQAPGDGNSLGRMKLVMPNPFSIFIHDTPAKTLFAKPVRAFSHGCIRTENPLDLAAALSGRSRAALDAIVAGGETTKVDVPDLPVFVVYLTATADAAGAVSLHKDLYGRDDRVAAALADGGQAD
jgi:L,D-transpeptidase YcbB